VGHLEIVWGPLSALLPKQPLPLGWVGHSAQGQGSRSLSEHIALCSSSVYPELQAPGFSLGRVDKASQHQVDIMIPTAQPSPPLAACAEDTSGYWEAREGSMAQAFSAHCLHRGL
jgi:hypothetical protein